MPRTRLSNGIFCDIAHPPVGHRITTRNSNIRFNMDASREYEITSNFPVLRFFGHSAGLSCRTAGTSHPGIGRDALALPLRPLHSLGGLAVDARRCGLRPAPALSVIWVTQFAGGVRFKYGGGPISVRRCGCWVRRTLAARAAPLPPARRGKYGCGIGHGGRRGRFWMLYHGERGIGVRAADRQFAGGLPMPPRPQGPGNQHAPLQLLSLLRAAVLSPGIRTTLSSP